MARRLPRSRLLALFLLFGYLTLQWTLLSSAGFHDGSANSARFHFDYLQSSSLDRVDKKGKDYVPIDLNNEIQKGLDYARSIKDTKRKLLFVHIPKVAGTTIEEVGGLQVKLAWGSCLFNHRPKRQGNVCRYPPGQFEWPTKIGYGLVGCLGV